MVSANVVMVSASVVMVSASVTSSWYQLALSWYQCCVIMVNNHFGASSDLITVICFLIFSFGSRHVTPRSLTSRFLSNMVCVEGIATKCKLPWKFHILCVNSISLTHFNEHVSHIIIIIINTKQIYYPVKWNTGPWIFYVVLAQRPKCPVICRIWYVWYLFS